MSEPTGGDDPERLERRLIEAFAAWEGADAGHDLGHARRVLRTARAIAAAEGSHDALALTAAALLHDCVSLPKDDPRRRDSSRLAAAKAADILRGMKFPPDRLATVVHAIEAHSFSASIAPASPEARAVQDADRLEALGAIGIARCFATSGALARPLFDPDDPLARRRPVDEGAWGLDHFQTKLLRLPEMMQTATGRAWATERAEFLRSFMQRLETEATPDAAFAPRAPGKDRGEPA